MFKKFAYAVNGIPFAGKLTIRPFAYHYWTATIVPKRVGWFIGLVLVLALFLFVHGSQAVQGFNHLDFDNNVLLNTVFFFYGLVNLAACIAQTHLLFRAIKFMFKRLPKTKRKYAEMGWGHMVLCIVVTLLGQIVFLVAVFLS